MQTATRVNLKTAPGKNISIVGASSGSVAGASPTRRQLFSARSTESTHLWDLGAHEARRPRIAHEIVRVPRHTSRIKAALRRTQAEQLRGASRLRREGAGRWRIHDWAGAPCNERSDPGDQVGDASGLEQNKSRHRPGTTRRILNVSSVRERRGLTRSAAPRRDQDATL